jgi:hypothetical protein
MATVDDWLAEHGFAPPANPLLQPPTPGMSANGPQVSPDTLAALGIDPSAGGGMPPGGAPPMGGPPLGGMPPGGPPPGPGGPPPGGPPPGGAPPGGGLSPDLMAALGTGGGPGGAGDMGGAPPPSVGATEDSAAPTLFGYSPQPRPPLPGGIGTPPEEGANDPFAQFRGAWGGGEESGGTPQDLLSSLTGGQGAMPGMPGETPPSRALTPPWMGGGSGGGSFGPNPAEPDGPGQQMMRDRFPAAMQRLNWLRDLRTRRGY